MRCYFVTFLLFFMSCAPTHQPETYSNTIDDDRMLLVLAAPSLENEYYRDDFDAILDFQVAYSETIMGNDNVIILVPSDAYKLYAQRLPEDILLEEEMYDIWMRDFTTINPYSPGRVIYTDASMDQSESEVVQKRFDTFAQKYGLDIRRSDVVIDGGNFVDNYRGDAIVTDRVLVDNNFSEDEAKKALPDAFGAEQIAVIPADDEALAHSDGMVSWIDDDVLTLNDYSDDPAFRSEVLGILEESFPDAKMLEVPVQFDDYTAEDGIGSACGIHLNAVLTKKHLYVPKFGVKNDSIVLDLLWQNTNRSIKTIDASGVCHMGGSVRCLTWQLSGENARKLIEAARQ